MNRSIRWFSLNHLVGFASIFSVVLVFIPPIFAGDPDPSKPYLITSHDPWIPNFSHPQLAKLPYHIVQSVKNGLWSDPSVWNGSLDDKAVVWVNHDVEYDVPPGQNIGQVAVVAVYSGGRLHFLTTGSTQLVVTHFQIMPGGNLEIGTPASPVFAGVTAEVIFRDEPINTSDPAAPFFDPIQYGNGLIVMGGLTIYGSVKSSTFARFSTEPQAGDTSVRFQTAVNGWETGDRLVFSESRQIPDPPPNFIFHYEEALLQSMSSDGKTATLAAPLKYSHPGARDADGTLRFLPHVGNLTRNVVVRSENRSGGGTRGHVMVTAQAAVDVRYAQFESLGRTTFDSLNSTLVDGNGVPQTIGINQVGRYAFHIHHLAWPAGPSPSFTFLGNSVFNLENHTRKWAIAIHNSDGGLIRQNVVYNLAGAGIVTEDGTEDFNVIEQNFVTRVTGDGSSRADTGFPGREGSGFWFRGNNNFIRDNVAAGPTGLYDFTFFGGGPFLEFARNEGYGGRRGLTMWEINGAGTGQPNPAAPQSVIKDFHGWHNWEGHIGLGYPILNVTFDGLVLRGDKNAMVGGSGWNFGDYLCKNCVITNADIQGMRIGIQTPLKADGPFLVEDSTLINYLNVWVLTPAGPGGGGGPLVPPRMNQLRNIKFGSIPNAPIFNDNDGRPIPQRDVAMDYFANHGANVVVQDQTWVVSYNQQVGQDYRVFYPEQHPDFVVPKTGIFDAFQGSPEAGLTNLENWNKYTPDGNLKTQGSSGPGLCIAGDIAPCSDASCSNRLNAPRIDGWVFPAVLPLLLSISSPRPGDIVSGTTVRILYQTFGNDPQADHIHFQMDDQTEVRDLTIDGNYTFVGVVPGAHVLQAYVARADHSKIMGTDASVMFRNTLNETPRVDAGPDMAGRMLEDVLLNGSVADDGIPGSVLSLDWNKISGPGNVHFSNPASAITRALFSSAGKYTLRLSASDGELTGSDEVRVSIDTLGAEPLRPGSNRRISPNPWRGNLNAGQPLVFSGFQSNAEISILTTEGTLVKKLSADDTGAALWEFDNLASGTYICRDGRSRSFIKFVILR